MARIASRRRVPSKLAKRQRALKIGLRVFIVVGLVMGLRTFLLFDGLMVQRVTVLGNNVVSSEDIIAIVQEKLDTRRGIIIPSRHILLIPRKQIQASLSDAFPRFADTTLNIRGLNTLEVSIHERTAAYVWCGDEFARDNSSNCYFVDPSGVVFDPVESTNDYLILYGAVSVDETKTTGVTGGVFFGTEAAEFFDRVERVRAILASFGLNTVSVVIDDNRDITLTTPDGFEFRFTQDQDLSLLLENAESLLVSGVFDEQSLEDLSYIDMRFGKKVFYK